VEWSLEQAQAYVAKYWERCKTFNAVPAEMKEVVVGGVVYALDEE
jgi:hypothetical protein